MSGIKVLVGVLGMSVLLGTVAFAEIVDGEPGTSNNPKDNVPQSIQRSSPSAEDPLPGGSGPGDRSDALSGLGHEKAVKEGHSELEKNVNKTQGGGAAMAADELQTEEQREIPKRHFRSKLQKEYEELAVIKVCCDFTHGGALGRTLMWEWIWQEL